MTRGRAARLQRALDELDRVGSVTLPGRAHRLWLLAAASLVLAGTGLAIAVGALAGGGLFDEGTDSPFEAVTAAGAFVLFGLAGGWLLPQQALRRRRGILLDRDGVRAAGGGLVRWHWIVAVAPGDRRRSATLLLDRPAWGPDNGIGAAVLSARTRGGALELPPVRGLAPADVVVVLDAAAARTAEPAAHTPAASAGRRPSAHEQTMQALRSSGRAVLGGRPLQAWLLVVLGVAFTVMSAALVIGPLSDLPFGSSRWDSPVAVAIGAAGLLLFGAVGLPLLVRRAARQGSAVVLDCEGLTIEGGPRIPWRGLWEIEEGDGSSSSATLRLQPAALRAHVAAHPAPLRLLLRGSRGFLRVPLLEGLEPAETAALLTVARGEALRR